MSTPINIDLGTVWEVPAQDGEILLFLVTDVDASGSFVFVRAVPLTDYMSVIMDGCVAVCLDSQCSPLYSAHCWLAGPVVAHSMIRRIGRVNRASINAVTETLTRGVTLGNQDTAEIIQLRKSLYDQFDPVFAVAWDLLYELEKDQHV